MFCVFPSLVVLASSWDIQADTVPPPLFAHLHHLNCGPLDPSSGCTSPHSIDGVALGSIVWSTSRIVLVQVRQTALDHYTIHLLRGLVSPLCYKGDQVSSHLVSRSIKDVSKCQPALWLYQVVLVLFAPSDHYLLSCYLVTPVLKA